MTRPHIIRADTIDLQDQDAPSAKDHSRHPATGGQGNPAPHQADALRHVELEISEQHGRSPRASQDLSGKELQLLHDEDAAHDRDPNHNLLSNSVQNGAEEEMQGEDGDESMDDDMIDKISSSPSIGEDGGYTLHLIPPIPGSSCSSFHSAEEILQKVPQGPPSEELFSSSPCMETPEHSPLSFPRDEEDSKPAKDHHQYGRYPRKQATHLTVDDDLESESRDQLSPLISEQRASYFQEDFRDAKDCYDADFDAGDFHCLLLPMSDPLLGDNSFEHATKEETSSDTSSPVKSSSSWEDEATGEHDDDTEDISYVDDDRFIDSGWGGECLRELEEIDFDFVYALHTFVATVEGQANATKGDTMVLLDDSNSYWWLVRVVKDSSIGYLPAEHIETPTERLARLNKHRNLDLSQTMLTDQEEDRKTNPLNPLKKAMRRRNVKTVQFAPPTYVEPSDYGATSDDEDEGGDEAAGQEEDEHEAQGQEQTRNGIDGAAVEPLATRDIQINGRGNEFAEQDPRDRVQEQATTSGKNKTSEEVFERTEDGTAAKSRKGTVRNTDSFFKDDGVETRKINLTPSLLRDDSSSNFSRSSDSTLRNRPSLDSLEKDAPPEKIKDKKEKKEKRGMLGGMFKRKDKKDKKGQKEDLDDVEKTSSEASRQSPQPKESMESLSNEAARANPQPHRQTSKLQKSPPAKLSPKSSYTNKEPSLTVQRSEEQRDRSPLGGVISADSRDRSPLGGPISADSKDPSIRTGPSLDLQTGPSLDLRPSGPSLQTDTIPAEPSRAPPPPVAGPSLSLRPVQQSPNQPESQRQQQQKLDDTPSPLAFQSRQLPQEEAIQQRASEDKSRNGLAPTQSTIKPISPSPQPVKAQEAQHRTTLDDFDSSSASDSEAPTTEPPSERVSHEHPRPEPTTTSDQHPHLAVVQAAQHEGFEARASEITSERSRESLSESPIEVPHPSQIQPQQYPVALNSIKERTTPHQPPPLVTDTSSSEHTSPLSPPSESPSLIEAPGTIPPIDHSDPIRDITGATTSHTPVSTTPLNASTNTNPTTADRTTLSSTSTTPTWSDASLRAYLDNDDSDIRDLLLVVHDKTGVVPRRDHPVVKNLYREENEKLDKISGDLDGLLNGYLARKGRAQSAR